MALLEEPGPLLGDNKASIHLVKNCQASQRTKQIKTRHHFVRDLWEDQILEISYINTNLNKADICTKNVSVRNHKNHKSSFRNKVLNFMKDYDDLI